MSLKYALAVRAGLKLPEMKWLEKPVQHRGVVTTLPQREAARAAVALLLPSCQI